MKEEKEITQSQVITLTYLQFSMMLLWLLINMVLVHKGSYYGWYLVILVIVFMLFVFTSFMYIRKHKKEPLSRYITIRAIIIYAISLGIMSFLMEMINHVFK
jgi:O-antigen/teichoic acid export membrane protein